MKYFLDITGEHCPMTFVKTKLRLEDLQPGDILEVLLTEGEPLDSLPKSVEQDGHKIVDIREERPFHRLVIEKQ